MSLVRQCRGRKGAALAVLLLGLALSSSADPVVAETSLQDDRGQALALETPARRLVTLAPGLAELVFAAGAGDRLVGASSFSDYPATVRQLPSVGDSSRLDLERILALRPDLAIAWKSGNRPADLERLERLGIPVFTLEPRRLEDVARALRAIGALAGTEGDAEAAAAAFERKIAELGTRYRHLRPVTVFYQIWHEPLITVNGTHIISDVVELCGGRNVFAALGTLTPNVSVEALLAADPRAIIISVSSPGEAVEAKRFLARLPQMQAVRGGRIYSVDPDLIQRQTPRLALGAREICLALDSVREDQEAAARAAQHR
jgi:iron complex transport system substrate-binding protein